MTPRLEVKICGLTRPAEAAAIAEAGADAIGLVFHPASPRHLDPARARAIVAALPPDVPAVGVFADAAADTVAQIADRAGARIVQLHGAETAETIAFLLARGFAVLKTVKAVGPGTRRAARALPDGCGLLVECGAGPLPGGNGAAWNWAAAAPFAAIRPFALAGGLTPDNAATAAAAARASAVDLSSGVETAPGRKSLEKCRRLMENLRCCTVRWPVSPLFRGDRSKGMRSCPVNR